jgi:hypothetical protein
VKVAVLFARSDSVYKTMPGTDVYDIDRDARTYAGSSPVVAHPPCRAWGRLSHMAKPRPDEKDLARWAVAQVRRFGGVLEHPSGSKLWDDQQLPRPGQRDSYGGWTMPVHQHWFGHKAEKSTLLYICGVEPSDVPAIPLRLGRPEYVIASSLHRNKKATWARPEVPDAEREHTPPEMAEWLVTVARSCTKEAP